MSKNQFLSVKIGDIMTKNVVSVDPSMTALHVAKLIVKHKVEGFPVLQEGKPIGIVTGWDLLTKVLAKGLDTNKTKVKQFMTQSPITCPPNYTILQAAKLMTKHNIKRVPVVQNNKVIGFFTSYDIALYRRIIEHTDLGH